MLSRATSFVSKSNFKALTSRAMSPPKSINGNGKIQTGDRYRYQLNDVKPEKLPLETKQVACYNMVTLTLKLCHQTFLVSYSTENRSNMK